MATWGFIEGSPIHSQAAAFAFVREVLWGFGSYLTERLRDMSDAR